MLFYFSISISVACLLLYYLATRVVGATIALIISSHYVQARGDYRMLLRHYGHHLGEVSQIYASLGKPPGVGGQQRSPLFEVQAVKLLMAQIESSKTFDGTKVNIDTSLSQPLKTRSTWTSHSWVAPKRCSYPSCILTAQKRVCQNQINLCIFWRNTSSQNVRSEETQNVF